MGNWCCSCLNKNRNRKSSRWLPINYLFRLFLLYLNYRCSSQLNVLLLGLDGAGKTEVLHILLKKKREDQAPTNGTTNHNFCYHGIDVNLKELGGSKDIRGIWKHYYQEVRISCFPCSYDSLLLCFRHTVLFS